MGAHRRFFSEQSVGRGFYTRRTAVEYVGVDHGRRDILVPQELLDRADVAARFEHVRCEGVSERVAGSALRDVRS